MAFLADVGDFFNCIGVLSSDTHAMRFLFWPMGDVERPLKVYKMTINCFGAASSPTNCIYAFQKNAEDHGDEFGANVVASEFTWTICQNPVLTMQTPLG